jgi:serine/threonine-protein kinase
MAGPLIGKFGAFEYSLAERYRFESELGRGGMGTVYRARDLRLPRMVAIKMLHTSLTNDYGVLRFQKEIEIASQLQHPNIVRLYDSGVADGRLYYVMEYLEGESLRDMLKREPQLSVDDALKITREVGEALQYAHDHGIVHRDVKPENIIIADGRAHVVDFGLARAISAADAERLTASGLAVGTPHYMAPEQGAGERNVGPLADQYALACVLYEMLTGEPPFTGPSAAAIALRHVSETPVKLQVRRQHTPQPLDAAVMRALEKVPTDRHSTISAFVFSCTARSVAENGFDKSRRAASRHVRTSVAALVVVLACGVLASEPGRSAVTRSYCAVSGSCLDTNSVLVVGVAGAAAGGTAASLALFRAMTHWRGFSIAQAGRSVSSIDTPEAMKLASQQGAGRVVTTEISRAGDASTVEVELRDVRTAARL